MLFNSFVFFGFLLVVLPVTYAWRHPMAKKYWLLVASYGFYGYWDWRFCGLLLLSTTVDFWVGKNLAQHNDPKKRKRWLWLSLGVNLGILALFKYFGFFVTSFSALVQSLGGNLDVLHLNLVLPMGISFYTFQTMSYTLDIYYRRMEPTQQFLDFALFVAFFPQLVAGPIERARALLPQLAGNFRPSKSQAKAGIILIISGLFRKVMIGDTSGRYVDHLFAQPEWYTGLELACGLILFSIQIYADFSGYSRIARGTAKLLGIDLMQNFAEPYFSRHITEFWRRWHISLSTWLRDYLYIPLGGNRKGKVRTYINLMITMLLGGLWHGAGWNFMIWGGLHGLYLAIHRARRKKIEPHIFIRWGNFDLRIMLQMLGTYLLVCVTWLFFRAPDLETVFLFGEKWMRWESSEFGLRFLRITFSYLLLVGVLDFLAYRNGHTHWLWMNPPAFRYGLLVGMLILVWAFMLQTTPMPFVYFQF